jgi:hypothetical protein
VVPNDEYGVPTKYQFLVSTKAPPELSVTVRPVLSTIVEAARVVSTLSAGCGTGRSALGGRDAGRHHEGNPAARVKELIEGLIEARLPILVRPTHMLR